MRPRPLRRAAPQRELLLPPQAVPGDRHARRHDETQLPRRRPPRRDGHPPQLRTRPNIIGNLTLTAYNAELSNHDFASKRKRFTESHVGLNAWFQSLAAWDREAVEARSELLAQRALTIWPFFGKTQPRALDSTSGITGKIPLCLVMPNKAIPVKTWCDVLQHTLQIISDRNEDHFLLIAETYPHYISLDAANLRTTRQLTNGFFFETHMSALAIDRLCRQALELAGLSSEDWHVDIA